MENPDASDLPAPVARVSKTVVETARRELAEKPTTRRTVGEKVKLSLCEGKIIGNLSREEIYDDIR